MEELFLGIDLGGSHIEAVIINKNGKVYNEVVKKLTDRSIDKVITIMCESIQEIFRSDVKSIGIGIPGNVDPITNSTRYLPNFGWFEKVPIEVKIKEKLTYLQNVPMTLRNDGRCAAIAEYRFGTGINSNVFVMITLGTGIGGALLINGELFNGSTYDAGDFGHHVMASGADAFQCICGKSGCFECHCSADGLMRQYDRVLNKLQCSKDDSIINAELFMVSYRNSNDDIFKIAFNNYKNDLANGLANIVTFYNPDVIAIGGGLSQANELYENLENMVDKLTLPATRGKVKIVPAKLSVRAGAIGAALLGFAV